MSSMFLLKLILKPYTFEWSLVSQYEGKPCLMFGKSVLFRISLRFASFRFNFEFRISDSVVPYIYESGIAPKRNYCWDHFWPFFCIFFSTNFLINHPLMWETRGKKVFELISNDFNYSLFDTHFFDYDKMRRSQLCWLHVHFSVSQKKSFGF